MEIILKRTKRNLNRVTGELAIDGVKIADTAENLAHMLPEGNYKMGIETVRRLHRKMLFITNGKAKRHLRRSGVSPVPIWDDNSIAHSRSFVIG